MGDNFDVLINLITKNSGDGAKVTTDALGTLDKRIIESSRFLEEQTILLMKQKAAAKELANEYKVLAEQYKGTERFSPEAKQRMAEQKPEYKRYLELGKAIDTSTKSMEEQAKTISNAKIAHRDLSRELKNEQEKQRDIEQAAQKTNVTLQRQATLLARTASRLERFGTGAMVGGTAIVGGIIAEANQFAKEAGMATQATRQWNAELTILTASRRRVDAILVKEALPLLEKAASLASKASRIIQEHPELVSAVLNTGVALATVGTLSKALSVPIRLISDKLYYTAQLGQIAALKENTAALTGRSLLGGVKAGAATSAGLIATGVTLAAGAGYLMYKTTVDAIAAHPGQSPVNRGRAGTGWMKDQEKLSASTDKAAASLDKLSNSSNKAAGSITPNLGGGGAGSDDFYRRYQNQAPPALTDFQIDTVLSIRSVTTSLTDLTANYTAQLGSITANFLQEQAAAEAQYANQRAQIIRDGGLEIERIEQDSQRRLAKLRLDHEDKMYSLALQRDALGIVQEQRNYTRAQDEEEENTNLEIKRRRADIALRLADMAKAYQAERKARQQQYQYQLAQAQQEFNLKRDVLTAELRDLQYALTHEREVKAAYNQAIIDDAAAFAAAYRATLATAYGVSATAPITGGVGHARRATGGYADYGQYLLGDSLSGGRGPREFVLSGRTTRAAEQMLGGLNQQKIIAALSSGGGGVHIIDQSRYATTISASDRRAIRQGAVRDTMDIIGANK